MAKVSHERFNFPRAGPRAFSESGISMQRNDELGEIPFPEIPSVNPLSVLDTPLVLDPKAPYDIAQQFVQNNYCREGVRTLHHHKGMFYAWSGRHYPAKDESALRAELYAFLDKGVRQFGDARVRFKPTRANVNDVLDAVEAIVFLDSTHCAPVWLCDAPVPANEIVPCQNGLLHLPSGKLLPHTPTFFAHNILDFSYDASAPQPAQWLGFLCGLWPDDPESIETLQEIFGLCLTGETRYQKAFMLIGPRRSGKGTIARVLTGLIGRDNVVAPTLSSLADPFGPAALIGKRVACISDARISKRMNLDKISERLLSITGEDSQTIERKYLDAWTGRLQVRFIVLSNELPEFDERSGALAGRFITIVMTRSFFGQEDLELTDKLLAELPAILNWAIAGWRRLRARGHFVQPKTGAEMVAELEDLSSPIKAFVRERCQVALGRRVECAVLYEEWRKWNAERGQHQINPINLFSRDLRAAVPGLRVAQQRLGGKQVRVFVGIGL